MVNLLLLVIAAIALLVLVVLLVLAHEIGCGNTDSTLLLRGHAFQRGAIVAILAVSYLDKHQCVLVLHDQVDFASSAIEIIGKL